MRAEGAELRVDGEGRDDPDAVLGRYAPRFELELFDTRFFLSAVREIPELRFFVAYVSPPAASRKRRRIHARIFYKDVSLVWRVASHMIETEDDLWIGKGDVASEIRGGWEHRWSRESTTDLPLEMQTALERLSRAAGRPKRDGAALRLVLRNAPPGRIAPYRDFTEPRRRAMADARNRINRGRKIARFTRKNDPASLRFAPGYEPDFRRGILERSATKSALYGGRLRRFRILSRNREIQYFFFAGARHVWIVPPQATTTELSSYGVRTVDVLADEELFVPGYEYHFLDEEQNPPVLHSQIPEGFVGPVCETGSGRADASPWLDRLPVIKQFRREVLGRRG